MDDRKLAQLLVQACPRPAYLASTDGGAILSLALHCLMVNAGFVLTTEGGNSIKDSETRFVPQKDWSGMLVDQWVFTYTKPGKARKFTLHCSLQSRTKRMFIHSCEENNYTNVCVLGLQLENYVPHPEALRTNRWAPADVNSGEEPVVRNAAKMAELLTQYVITPLLAAAEDEQGPPPDAAGSPGERPPAQPGPPPSGWLLRGSWPQRPGSLNNLTVAALAVLALGAVGVVLLRSRGALLQQQRRA